MIYDKLDDTQKAKAESFIINLHKYNMEIPFYFLFNRHSLILADKDCNFINFGISTNINCFDELKFTFYSLIIKDFNDEEREDKSIKRYTYVRAISIAKIFYIKIKEYLKNEYKMTDEDLIKIRRINYRVFFNRMDWTRIICRFKMRYPEDYNYLMNDMLKFPIGFCRYLLNQISLDGYRYNGIDYKKIIKQTPKQIKNLKYMVNFNKDDIKYLEKHNIKLETKLQYFMYIIIKPYLPDFISDDPNDVEYLNILLKLLTIKKSDFLYYRKTLLHKDNAYPNFNDIRHLCHLIHDGYRMGKHDGYLEIKGSVKKMIQKSIFNHRLEKEKRKSRLLEEKENLLIKSPFKLPDWLEEIRLKTTHQIIIAGIECNHCIGNYSNDKNHLFFRDKNNCCLQLNIENKRVIQCYDINDTVTKNSKELERKVNNAMSKIKKEK